MSQIDIAEVFEINSGKTCLSITSKSIKASVDYLTSLSEDEEDVLEGKKALLDKKGTITWEHYQKRRME